MAPYKFNIRVAATGVYAGRISNELSDCIYYFDRSFLIKTTFSLRSVLK